MITAYPGLSPGYAVMCRFFNHHPGKKPGRSAGHQAVRFQSDDRGA